MLTATLTSSLLAPQVRQIGLMKAIGARSAQIMQIYAVLILAIGLLAVGIGLPLGIAAGRALAGNTARMLNLELARQSVPAWLYAQPSIDRCRIAACRRAAAHQDCREAHGSGDAERTRRSHLAIGPGRIIRWFSGSGRHPAFVQAIRNITRRKGRLALTLALLAAAGALFLTSLNVRAAWLRTLAAATIERHIEKIFKGRFASRKWLRTPPRAKSRSSHLPKS